MEDILHQLVDGLSPYNPIIYHYIFTVFYSYSLIHQLVQDFVHPHVKNTYPTE